MDTASSGGYITSMSVLNALRLYTFMINEKAGVD